MNSDIITLSKPFKDCKISDDDNDNSINKGFDLGPNLFELQKSDGLRELQTVIRDK